jgi:adenylylsulfate reductase subunit B
MPTFVYMTSCDGCGHCVDICPSDIMHIDTTYRRAYNIEPNMCWECYSCVKACPQNAIDVRGYADFAPMNHSVRGPPNGAPFPRRPISTSPPGR